MKVAKSQRKANEKWKKNNKDKQRFYNYRSTAKSFIRNYASEDDLHDLVKLINEQLKKDE